MMIWKAGDIGTPLAGARKINANQESSDLETLLGTRGFDSPYRLSSATNRLMNESVEAVLLKVVKRSGILNRVATTERV